jgi:hypothetical protein
VSGSGGAGVQVIPMKGDTDYPDKKGSIKAVTIVLNRNSARKEAPRQVTVVLTRPCPTFSYFCARFFDFLFVLSSCLARVCLVILFSLLLFFFCVFSLCLFAFGCCREYSTSLT